MTRKKQSFENKEEETVSPKVLRKPGEGSEWSVREKSGQCECAEVRGGK